MKTYTGHVNRTYCLFTCFGFGADESGAERKAVISGSEDGKVYIWDLQSRKVLQVLDGHRGMSVPLE